MQSTGENLKKHKTQFLPSWIYNGGGKILFYDAQTHIIYIYAVLEFKRWENVIWLGHKVWEPNQEPAWEFRGQQRSEVNRNCEPQETKITPESAISLYLTSFPLFNRRDVFLPCHMYEQDQGLKPGPWLTGLRSGTVAAICNVQYNIQNHSKMEQTALREYEYLLLRQV